MGKKDLSSLKDSERALISSTHIKVSTLIVFDPEFCDQLYYYIKSRSEYKREFRAVSSLIGVSTVAAIVNSVPDYNTPQFSAMVTAGLGFGAYSIKGLIDRKRDLDLARKKVFNDIITKEMKVPKKLLVRFFNEYFEEPNYLAQVGDIDDERFMKWFNNNVNAGFKEDEILDGILKDSSVLKAWLSVIKSSQQTLDRMIVSELFKQLDVYGLYKDIPEEVLVDILPEYKEHPEYYNNYKNGAVDEKN